MTLLIFRPAAALGAAALAITVAAPALAQGPLRTGRNAPSHALWRRVVTLVPAHPRHRSRLEGAGAVTGPGYGYVYRSAVAPGAYGYGYGGYNDAPRLRAAPGTPPATLGAAASPPATATLWRANRRVVAVPFNLAGAIRCPVRRGRRRLRPRLRLWLRRLCYAPGYGVGTIEETPAVYQSGYGYGYNRGPFGP